MISECVQQASTALCIMEMFVLALALARMLSFYLNSLNDIMPPILFTPQIENNKTFLVWHKWELCFVF